MVKKNKLIYIIVVVILISIYILYTIFDFVNKKEALLYLEKHNNIALNYKNQRDILIDEKRNATLALTLALAKNNEKIRKFFLNNEKIDLNDLSLELKEYTDFKNVWFHLVDKNGISVYRSWVEQKDDKIVDIRKDLQEIIKNPKISTTISIGKFDMTLKAIVPVFDDNNFIGIIETITHFNSISKNLENRFKNTKTAILVEKEYFNQLKDDGFSRKFIDKYYVANMNIDEDVLNYLEKQDLQKLTSKESFYLQDGYLIVNNFIKYEDKKLANFIFLTKLDSIDYSEILEFRKNSLIHFLFSIGLLLLLSFGFFYYIYSKNLKNLYEKLNKNKEKLQKFNLELKDTVENEVRKNNEKNRILFRQNKMAAMGEMLENIAHQWRQPLSLITTEASSIKIKKLYGMLDEEEHIKSLDSIIDTSNYLSNTIDDFRYYFSPNKTKNLFNTVEFMEKCLKLLSYDMKNSEINIIKEVESFEIESFENELLQVIINILNNAKDQLLKQKKDSEKYIFIELKKVDELMVLNIKDNAGGIDEDIIDRIFEPYFTTKHKSKGTGLGLYMGEEIIKRHLNGDINVKNIRFKYENTNFNGAIFEITIPIK